METMVPNAAIRNLIREDKVHQIYSAMQVGQLENGMQTFNQSLAHAGLQTLDHRGTGPVDVLACPTSSAICSAAGQRGNCSTAAAAAPRRKTAYR